MNKKIIAIAAVAVLSGLAVVSCGNDVAQDSEVSVALPKVTAAQDEKATTQSGETTKKDSKTTTAAVVSGSEDKTSKDEDTTKDTETTAADSTEPTEAPTTEQQKTEAPTTEQPTEPTPVVTPGRSDLSFGYGSLLGGASGTVSSLGTPNSTATASGCLTNGADQKIYYYNAITLLCYESGGTEYIYDIKVTGQGYQDRKLAR